MPARKVGDVYLEGEVRGSKAQAYKEGAQMGEAAEAGFNAAFNERFKSKFSGIARTLLGELEDAGRLGGIRISDAMERAIRGRLSGFADEIAEAFLTPEGLDNFAANFDRVDDAVARLRTGLQELHDTGNLNDEMWNRFGGTLNQWAGKARKVEDESDRMKATIHDLNEQIDREVTNHDRVVEAMERHTETQKRLRAEVDKTVTKTKALNTENEHGASLWKRLSANTRQWTLIIAAVISGLQQLDVLAIGAAAGLFILGDAFAALISGAVVLGVAFVGMFGDLKKIPEGARPAAEALQALAGPLKELQDLIQVRVFAGLADEIKQIGTVLIPGLQDGILELADFVNATLGDIFDTLFDQHNIELFSDAIANAGPLFQDLVAAGTNLGLALLEISRIAQPFVKSFTSGLKDLLGRFLAFTKTVEGEKAITRFFENGTFILGKFGDLLGGVMTLLGNLASDRAVEKTGEFLDHLTAALPFLEQLMDTLGPGALDIFGLIAEILDVIGNSLSPLLDGLAPVFRFLNELISALLPQIGLLLQFVGTLLLPLQFAFDILAKIVQKIAEHFAPAQEAASELLTAFQEAADVIFEALQPAIDVLIDAFVELLPSPEELARIIRDEVIPNVKKFADWVKTDLVPIIENWAGKIANVIEAFDRLMDGLAPVTRAIQTFAQLTIAALKPLFDFIMKVVGGFMSLLGLIDTTNAKRIDVPQPSGFGGGRFATGGVATSASTFGEAGPELAVPIALPLNQVDESVREIAAFLRGRVPTTPGAGVTVIFEDGAIRSMATDSANVALDVADAIAEEVAA